MSFLSILHILFSLSLLRYVSSFDITRNDNLVLYWGQNSYGATHSNTADYQQRLSFYCGSDSVTDTFPLAFLTTFFGEGGVPSMDFSNICSTDNDPVFSGTELPNCSFMASDIETCQAAGKIVTISLGGATGAVGFTSDSQAQSFADQIWNIFLGGSSSTRPFGNAVLDGIDLDVEGGGSAHYAAFVTQLQTHFKGASKKYYVTAAPQCPFPDANLGSVINAVPFDAVYVQFYNNYCGLQAFSNPNDWNFGTWDNWAKTTSPNKNVKVYIGAPADSTAAGSGYVDAGTLANVIQQTKSQFSSFGGVMMWDASQAYANGRFDVAAKNALTGGSSAPSPTSSKSSSSSSSSSKTSSAPSSTPTSGGCAGVAAWQTGVAYVGGDSVSFNGHLWTAKWWTENDTPGGQAGVWTDDGACTSAAVATKSVKAIKTPVADVSTRASSEAQDAKSTPNADDVVTPISDTRKAASETSTFRPRWGRD
ncbi:glycoside hydrolase [Schizopora paradoxa]|uniref:chitinase n=1 Tax=Schizopora paradoxa TaxID=27342 RepID=A0A0H2RJJ4_9AGAM|nr:glycoside hydrolase [Schizopora paradoxa]